AISSARAASVLRSSSPPRVPDPVAVFVSDGQESAIRRGGVIGKVLIEGVRFTREFGKSVAGTEGEWVGVHRNEHQPSPLRRRGVARIVVCPSDTEKCHVSPRYAFAQAFRKARQQINAQPGEWNASWMSARLRDIATAK